MSKTDPITEFNNMTAFLLGFISGAGLILFISIWHAKSERDAVCKSINDKSYYDENLKTCAVKTVTKINSQ